MELQEKIERQISLAVREVVIRFSRNDVPDVASLALAIASGETAQSLAEKVTAKVDRRNKANVDKSAARAGSAAPAGKAATPNHPANTVTHPSRPVTEGQIPGTATPTNPTDPGPDKESNDTKEESGRAQRGHAPTHHKK